MKQTSNFSTIRLSIEENLELKKIANNLRVNKSEFLRLLIRPYIKEKNFVAGYEIHEKVLENFYRQTSKNLQVCLKHNYYPNNTSNKKRKIKK